jgi:hypothetical protein
MALPNAERALGPMEFRFTDPDDIGKFGEGWFIFSEGDLLRKPARELIELETELGMPIVHLMNGFRAGTVLGDTAAAWYGVRAMDPARAGEFDAFNPISMMIEWRAAPGKSEAAPAATPEPLGSDSPIAGASPNTNSETPATVVLQTLPIVGSGT